MAVEKKNTVFCDIDGTLFKYRKFETYETTKPDLLDGVVEKMTEWKETGHMIILTTARPESMRQHTVLELGINNVEYHKLVMGIARGPRILINDNEEKDVNRAFSINVQRNTPFTDEQEKLFINLTK